MTASPFRNGRQLGLATLVLFAGPCRSLAESGPHLGGAGAQVCAVAWSPPSVPASVNQPAVQWVLGYVTGRLEGDRRPFHRSLRGPDGIALFVRQYCLDHPGEQLGDAATAFVDQLFVPEN